MAGGGGVAAGSGWGLGGLGLADGDFDAFAGGVDAHGVVVHVDEFACPIEHGGDFGVVVVGVVMEEAEAFDLGEHAEGDDIIDAAVAPTDAFGVFGVVVLGVHDEEVGLVEELDELLVLFAGVADIVVGGFTFLVGFHALVGFVVGEVGD